MTITPQAFHRTMDFHLQNQNLILSLEVEHQKKIVKEQDIAFRRLMARFRELETDRVQLQLHNELLRTAVDGYRERFEVTFDGYDSDDVADDSE